MISIVVLTHNRAHLLRQCVERVLTRTSQETREIVIWDNGATDGTREYLDSISDARVRIVHHRENIGQNAYAHAFSLTSQPYLLELDDDVIDAPSEWDRTLLEAYRALPRIGFLAANLVDDPHDDAARIMHHVRPHSYTRMTENGVKLLKGPTGGGCTITSRELHDRVGGFRQQKGKTFFLEDQSYVADIAALGYEAAYLEDLRVHHAGGAYYSQPSADKLRYWRDYTRRQVRKRTVKRILLRIPLVAPLNARYDWFQPPDRVY